MTQAPLLRSVNQTFYLFQPVESTSVGVRGCEELLVCWVMSGGLQVAGQWRINQASELCLQSFLAKALWTWLSLCSPLKCIGFVHYRFADDVLLFPDLCLTLMLFKIHSWFFDFFLLVKDLKVWRTDPGSIFDLDPLEDNIQSRSLHMLSGTAYILSSSPFMRFCPESEATPSGRGRGSWYRLCDVNCKTEDLKNKTNRETNTMLL